MARGSRKEVPKAAVKKAYVEGMLQPDNSLIYPTTVQLAEQFGVARETVSRWINRENWETDRALYQQRLEEVADARKARMLPDAPDVERTAAELAEDLKTHGVRSTAAVEPEEASVAPPDFRTHVIAGERAKFDTTSLTLAKALQMEIAASINRSRKKVNGLDPEPLAPQAILRLASALGRAQQAGRLALGQTTENQGHGGLDGGPLKVDSNVSVNDGSHGTGDLTPAELARLYAEEIRTRPADSDGQTSSGNHGGAPRQ